MTDSEDRKAIFDFVKGSTAFDDESQLWIPYGSHSDALMARFAIALKIPAHLVTTLLCILKDPAFQVEDLTFESIGDIFGTIADHRHDLAQKRAAKSATISPNAGVVPEVILENVVDLLVEERGGNEFHELPINSHRLFWDMQAHHTLLNLSLVHRTWTPHVQRAIRNDIYVYGSISLRTFLRSPLHGNWITDFHYSPFAPGHAGGHRRNDEEKDTFSLLAAFLDHTPNLRRFHLHTRFICMNEITSIRVVIDKLKSLDQLEELYLSHRHRHMYDDGPGILHKSVPCLPELAASLSKMPSLKYLSLRNWGVGDQDQDNPGNDNESSERPAHKYDFPPPSRQLKTIAYLRDEAKESTELISLLIQRRGNYLLDTVYLALHDLLNNSNSAWQMAAPDCPDLRTLQLLCNYPKQTALEVCAAVASSYPGLQGLTLILSHMRNPIDFSTLATLPLPPSVHNLTIHIQDRLFRYQIESGEEIILDVEQDLESILTAFVCRKDNHLHKLDIIFRTEKMNLPLTASACLDRSIEFSCSFRPMYYVNTTFL